MLEIFKVYTVDQSSAAFFEQIADPGGGPQNFLPVQGPAVSSSISPEHAGLRGFRTFSHPKKVRRLPARWMKICPGTSAHPRRRLVRFIMLFVMTSGCRSRPMTKPYFWHRVEQKAVWRMPPGTRPAWLRVHEGLFFHIETETVQHSLSGTF